MPTTCLAANYECYSFPQSRSLMLIPTVTIPPSAGNSIALGSYMMNPYYSRDDNFVIVVQRTASPTAEVYRIGGYTFTPVQESPFTNTPTSMTITPTQTPGYWLRNYANTAIFDITGLYIDPRIKAFYLSAPTDVSSFDANYCNASLTDTSISIYPLRFYCTRVSNRVLRFQIDPQDFVDYAANANVWS